MTARVTDSELIANDDIVLHAVKTEMNKPTATCYQPLAATLSISRRNKNTRLITIAYIHDEFCTDSLQGATLCPKTRNRLELIK